MSTQRSTLLAAAVTLALSGTAAAPAQAAQSTSGSEQIEEVIVTGIRGSLQQSIETKRAAVAVVDAITAEDVGKFPDKNLAEALQRVPGIVINREFGEGERVNLRGTATNLTRTLLNGHGLATADWFILDQLNTTRSFNYLMLPSDVIGKVEVFKSPQADMEEGGVGGVINVSTRNPLDLDPNTMLLSAQSAYSEMSEDFDPQLSALYSWRDPDRTFGFMIAAIHQERNLRRDGFEVFGYEDHANVAGNVLTPTLIGSALFEQERIRTGGNIGIQFSPSDQVDVNVTGLYSRFEADNSNQNYIAWAQRALNGEAGNAACPITGTLTDPTIVGNTAVAGTITSSLGGTCGFAVVYDAIRRFATAETRNIDADVTVRPAEGLELHFRAGYTDAFGNTDAQPFVEFGAPGRFRYDLRGDAPAVQFLPNDAGNTVDPTDPSTIGFIFSSLNEIVNEDSETYFYVDALKDVEWGPVNSLKFGLKNTDHHRRVTLNATTYGSFHVPLNTLPPSTFASGLTPGDFMSDIAGPGTLRSYWDVDFGTVESILFPNLLRSGRVLYPSAAFSVNEEAWAGYAMANMSGDRWRGNIGVRYVRTEQESSGNQLRDDGVVRNPFAAFTPVSAERTYSDVLPAANFAFDLTDDLVLRAAAAKVMARPDFTDVAPRQALNTGALSGTEGNPDLDPFRATQADLALEWYPDQGTLFALGVFYKDIKSFITDSPQQRIVPFQTATPPGGCTPSSTPGVFNCPFTINVRSNGGGGEIKGAELSVTKPLWAGFGVTGNYTYADGEADNGDELPGNSEDTFNVSAYFENPRISARLSYTYRSEFFVQFDRTTELNQKALESVDLSVVLNLLEGVALTFDAINLTDEEVEQFADEEFQPRTTFDNGRVFFGGVRLKF